MVVYLLVDTSASMRYAGEKRQPKYYMAAKIAAALAYLVIHQGDKAALGLFADKLTRFLPAGGTRRHLYQLVTELERVQPASTTGLADALRECHAVFKKRGRLVVLSDFWTDLGPLLEALSQFAHRRFEVLLLQVVDPDELFLPPQQTARFVDLETGEQVQADLEEIRPVYRQNMRQRIDGLAREAEALRIQHSLVDTREPYQAALEAYLGFRGKASLQFS